MVIYYGGGGGVFPSSKNPEEAELEDTLNQVVSSMFRVLLLL